MQEREEVLEYLEDLIPENIAKEIIEKAETNEFYLDVDGSYQQYEDFQGNVKTNIIANDEVIGEIDFLINQKSLTLSDMNEMMDVSFDDFVDIVKIVNYNIF
jgi:hypothetical protein